MAHTDLPIGGLRSREMDERVGIEYALAADDLELDRGGIEGRHGYRHAATTPITEVNVDAGEFDP